MKYSTIHISLYHKVCLLFIVLKAYYVNKVSALQGGAKIGYHFIDTMLTNNELNKNMSRFVTSNTFHLINYYNRTYYNTSQSIASIKCF